MHTDHRRSRLFHHIVSFAVLFALPIAFAIPVSAVDFPSPQPSKIAASVQRAMARIDAVRSSAVPAGKSQHDLGQPGEGSPGG